MEAPSKEEVVKWAQRCPADEGDTIEIRQIFGPDRFRASVDHLRADCQVFRPRGDQAPAQLNELRATFRVDPQYWQALRRGGVISWPEEIPAAAGKIPEAFYSSLVFADVAAAHTPILDQALVRPQCQLLMKSQSAHSKS